LDGFSIILYQIIAFANAQAEVFDDSLLVFIASCLDDDLRKSINPTFLAVVNHEGNPLGIILVGVLNHGHIATNCQPPLKLHSGFVDRVAMIKGLNTQWETNLVDKALCDTVMIICMTSSEPLVLWSPNIAAFAGILQYWDPVYGPPKKGPVWNLLG
jgi:hypothetical protein